VLSYRATNVLHSPLVEEGKFKETLAVLKNITIWLCISTGSETKDNCGSESWHQF
jgi:hypothetical protein